MFSHPAKRSCWVFFQLYSKSFQHTVRLHQTSIKYVLENWSVSSIVEIILLVRSGIFTFTGRVGKIYIYLIHLKLTFSPKFFMIFGYFGMKFLPIIVSYYEFWFIWGLIRSWLQFCLKLLCKPRSQINRLLNAGPSENQLKSYALKSTLGLTCRRRTHQQAQGARTLSWGIKVCSKTNDNSKHFKDDFHLMIAQFWSHLRKNLHHNSVLRCWVMNPKNNLKEPKEKMERFWGPNT